MALPSKSKLNQRVRDLKAARMRLGSYEPRDEDEAATKAAGLDKLNRQIVVSEQSLQLVRDIEALKENAAPLEQDLKKVEKLRSKVPDTEKERAAALDREINEKKETLDQIKAEVTTKAKTAETLESSEKFDPTAKPKNVTEMCAEVAPGIDVKKPPICNAGDHDEEVEFPKVPPDEVTAKERIEKLAAIASSKGDTFEADAAMHNVTAENSTIDSGAQISRDLTDEEIANGVPRNTQRVMLVCEKCGRKREIDHFATMGGKETLVECKNKKSLDKPDFDKMKDNRAFAKKMNWQTCYKFKGGQASESRRQSVQDHYFGDEVPDGTLKMVAVG